MAKKFNLYEELINNGFRIEEDERYHVKGLVRDDFRRECEVLWYGRQVSTMKVEVWFNSDMTVCNAYYYDDGRKSPFKRKTHMADKRAYNAIKATIGNNGYEF